MTEMEFSVKKVVSGCRLGEISFVKENRCVLETPACMLYMRGGAAPHLTNNLVDECIFDYTGVQVTLPTVFQYPGPDILRGYSNSLEYYFGIKNNNFVYCSVHDPAQKIQCSYNEEKNISLWNTSGRKKINVDQFIEIMTAFQPDIMECLCDTVPDGQTAKRNRKSVDRTLKYLDEVLENMKSNKILNAVATLGAIQGGDSKSERVRCAVETSKRPVSGFVIEGISFSSKHGKSNLEACTSQLTKEKPCFFAGAVSPDDIFSAVECGIDVFDSCFAYQATQRGSALSFNTSNKRYKPAMNHATQVTSTTSVEPLLQPISNVDKTHICEDHTQFEINLGNEKYKDDFSPLVVSCCCYSCTNHTRAYVYHLLETKEMLAQVLLMIHNFHQYFQFFKQLREAVKNDTYKDFKNNFIKS